jgi:CTP:molybdopterin cytidylyltransferase MocA
MLGAVLLAAGSATRMGRRPKCLLELDRVSLIKRVVLALTQAGVDELVVVSGHYYDQVEPEIANLAVTLIRNSCPDEGHTSSLRLGLAALSSAVDRVIVALSDQPLIDRADIRELLNAYDTCQNEKAFVVPIVQHQPGNPVIFNVHVKDEILAKGADFGGKQWRIANPEKVYRWPSANEHFIIDVDSPEDIQTVLAKTGLQLRWPHPSSKPE